MPRGYCRQCGGRRFWQLSDGRKRCVRCRYTFRSSAGRSWKVAQLRSKLVEYFCLGVPAYRLRWRVPLSQPTIQRVFRSFREAIYRESIRDTEALTGSLELDETMVGGRRRGKRGWGAAGKVVVFGILKRDGVVRVFPVPRRRKRHVLPLIAEHTTPGSLYFTDGWEAYTSLAVRGSHVVVEKEKGRPLGRDHLNGIEGFWSYAKTWLYHYRGIRTDVFHLYLKEVEWRFNHRNEDLVPLLERLLNER